MKRLVWLMWPLLLAGVGCVAPVGVSTLSIPRDAGNVCVGQCASIGMGLSAVAIMANNIGCVCQGRAGAPAPAPATTGAASATAGMVTISMIQREQESQQQERQQAAPH